MELRFSSPETQERNIDDWRVGFARFPNGTLKREDPDLSPLAEFTKQALEPGYGKLLADWTLAEPEVKEGFSRALGAAMAKDWTLRLRVLIGPSAPELHALQWERFAFPDDEGYLALDSKRIHFSRYLHSADWGGAERRAGGRLRGLLIVANPPSLSKYLLEPVELPEVIDACATLPDVDITQLVGPSDASLARIMEELQRQPVDFLFLACHGKFMAGDTHLFLANAPGVDYTPCPGSTFAHALSRLAIRPRLVVLLSCDSSGRQLESDRAEVLGAIAPALAAAGVPAVVGVQGRISQTAGATFLKHLLVNTSRDGRIDRAMAEARQLVKATDDGTDWWRPVLYSRLRTGQLWYSPRALTEDGNFWISVKAQLAAGQLSPAVRGRRKGCVPLLGFELAQRLLGGSRSLARRWAEANAIPLSSPEAENLPQLAQYLTYVRRRENALYGEGGLFSFLRKELVQRYNVEIAHELSRAGHTTIRTDDLLDEGRYPLHELISLAGRNMMRADPEDPHRVLARLKLPLYVTAAPSTLMYDALEMEGRKPKRAAYPWRLLNGAAHGDREPWPLQLDDYDHWMLDPEQPLVYHLFGVVSDFTSLCITEDDFIDYLVNFFHGAADLRSRPADPGMPILATRTEHRFPLFLGQALRTSALLLIGFSFDDWSFRVLVRSLRSLGAFEATAGDVQHMAVQVHPDEGRGLSPEAAQTYLRRYFEDARITLFLGSARDFTAKLSTLPG